MSNFQTFALITEGNISTAPSKFIASTVDSLATVLVAGYMTDLQAQVKANDVISINYADLSTFPLNTGESASYGQFVVGYANSVWSLTQVPSSALKSASVAITAAEFLGMYAAPKLLVAAPGAGYQIVLDNVSLVETYVAAAFAAGGVTAVQWDSTANGAGIIASSTLAAASFQVTASSVFAFNSGVVTAPFATTSNKGLYLSNVTQAFTTGDSTFVAHVNYHVIAV